MYRLPKHYNIIYVTHTQSHRSQLILGQSEDHNYFSSIKRQFPFSLIWMIPLWGHRFPITSFAAAVPCVILSCHPHLSVMHSGRHAPQFWCRCLRAVAVFFCRLLLELKGGKKRKKMTDTPPPSLCRSGACYISVVVVVVVVSVHLCRLKRTGFARLLLIHLKSESVTAR